MAEAVSPQVMSELIGSIYDCALDPSRWEQTLSNVMDALDCHALALHLTDLRHQEKDRSRWQSDLGCRSAAHRPLPPQDCDPQKDLGLDGA
jgi:hypothetical protein